MEYNKDNLVGVVFEFSKDSGLHYKITNTDNGYTNLLCVKGEDLGQKYNNNESIPSFLKALELGNRIIINDSNINNYLIY